MFSFDPPNRCDSIGQFWKVFGHKFSFKSSQNGDFFGYFESNNLNKNCCGIFSVNFGNNWATFLFQHLVTLTSQSKWLESNLQPTIFERHFKASKSMKQTGSHKSPVWPFAVVKKWPNFTTSYPKSSHICFKLKSTDFPNSTKVAKYFWVTFTRKFVAKIHFEDCPIWSHCITQHNQPLEKFLACVLRQI